MTGVSEALTAPTALTALICCGCGDPVDGSGISHCACPTGVLFRRSDQRHEAKKRPCAWCGVAEFRAVLDGEALCQSCCHQWVRGESRAN